MNWSKVACIGETLIVAVQTIPGALEGAETFSRAIGGAETNVAIGLASIGVSTAILTRVGSDGFGRYAVDYLRQCGVDTSGIEFDEHRSTGLYVKERGGVTDSIYDLGPGRSRMHYYRAGSAASALSPEYIQQEPAARILAESTLIHTTGITPALSDGAQDMIMTVAGSRGSHQLLSFDVNWRPSLWETREQEGRVAIERLVRASDVVFVGAEEAGSVFGETSPQILRDRFPEPRWLVVKSDSGRITAFDRGVRFDLPITRIDAVEVIGAGDAFAAGFLRGILGSKSLESCLREGHMVAARALTTTGDHVGTPRHNVPQEDQE